MSKPKKSLKTKSNPLKNVNKTHQRSMRSVLPDNGNSTKKLFQKREKSEKSSIFFKNKFVKIVITVRFEQKN